MMADKIEEVFSETEKKYNLRLKEEQKQAIDAVVNGNDVFVVLPTGYGKSYIYSFLPEIFGAVRGEKASVLVISPLQALMIDQVQSLNDIGIKSTYVGEMQDDKNIAKRISNGDFSVVFASPESVLSSSVWRSCITRGNFQQSLKAVAIDEAHCITQWGGDFRKEYSRLSEIRSVIPTNTPFIALTATATEKMKIDVMKTLNMQDETTTTVAILPERSNITYSVYRTNKDMEKTLHWLVKDLSDHQEYAKKTIIYCRNVNSCALIYELFMLSLGDKAYVSSDKSYRSRLCAMFHRSTAETNKQHVLEEFKKCDSKLRVVIATVAFGMGVNIPDVDYVIHWGSPRGLEQFAQESGRAGRDGRPAFSVIYYSGYDLITGRSSADVKSFCKDDTCLRKHLHNYFSLSGISLEQSTVNGCSCCLVCKKTCTCQQCIEFPGELSTYDDMNSEVAMEFDGEMGRNLGNNQIQLLKANLCDFKSVLVEEMGISVNMVSSLDIIIGIDDEMINTIVNNCSLLMCAEDIISLGLWKHDLASDILELIEEVDF